MNPIAKYGWPTINNLAELHGEAGQLDDALSLYQQARKLLAGVAGKHAELTDASADLAMVITNLGVLHQSQGQLAAAIGAFEESRGIQADLVRRHPTRVDIQAALAASHNNLAVAQENTANRAEAFQNHAEACRILEGLVRERPTTANRRDLARSHANLGRMYRAMDRVDEAADAYQKSRSIWERLLRDDPDDIQVRSDFGILLHNVGALTQLAGRHVEAAKLYREAIAQQKIALDRAPQSAQYRGFLKTHYAYLIKSLREAGETTKVVEAESELRELSAPAKR